MIYSCVGELVKFLVLCQSRLMLVPVPYFTLLSEHLAAGFASL